MNSNMCSQFSLWIVSMESKSRTHKILEKNIYVKIVSRKICPAVVDNIIKEKPIFKNISAS